MRIAFITSEFVTEPASFDGGLSNYLQRVTIGLKNLGHEPIVVVASDRNGVITHHDIAVHRVKIYSPVSRLFFKIVNTLSKNLFTSVLYWFWQSYWLNRRTKKIHKETRLDLVQYASTTATGLCRLRNVPGVVRISAYQTLMETVYEASHHPFTLHQIEKYDLLNITKADAVFCPSKFVADIVQKKISKPVAIIRSPFLLERITHDFSAYKECFENRKYLLFFGTVGVLKGVAVIAEIILDVLDSDPDLFFGIIGKDFGYKGGSMMDVVYEKAGVHRDRVIYMGKMPHNKLYPIIQNAYAVVLPSLIDNFPNTCLEAMAHKKIVIGSIGASFEEMLTDGVNGFLCKKNDPGDLLNVLWKVLALPDEKRRQIADEAACWIKTLKPEIVVRKLEEFYNDVIEKTENTYISN